MDRPSFNRHTPVKIDSAAIAPITSLTATRDAAQVQAVIRAQYGFEPTLDYCAALVDFVEALTDGQQRA